MAQPLVVAGEESETPPVEYLIKQYALEQGALEIQYIEEFFGEFQRRKTAAEIVRRLNGRDHIILMAEAPLPEDPASGPVFELVTGIGLFAEPVSTTTA